ncbi:GNAT family N-acetyltransferase [Priestia flexa]|nr:GNAT family N-acetyltransferase [Priestia flexa]
MLCKKCFYKHFFSSRKDGNQLNVRQISKEDTWQLRQSVMWPDKNIEYVKIDNDHEGIHYGLFDHNELCSVISLFVQGDTAQFRKFATDTSRQGKGYGTTLLNYVINEAKEMNTKIIWCNARKNKTTYYKRFGLTPSNETFQKGGVDYVIMSRHL